MSIVLSYYGIKDAGIQTYNAYYYNENDSLALFEKDGTVVLENGISTSIARFL